MSKIYLAELSIRTRILLLIHECCIQLDVPQSNNTMDMVHDTAIVLSLHEL